MSQPPQLGLAVQQAALLNQINALGNTFSQAAKTHLTNPLATTTVIGTELGIGYTDATAMRHVRVHIDQSISLLAAAVKGQKHAHAFSIVAGEGELEIKA